MKTRVILVCIMALSGCSYPQQNARAVDKHPISPAMEVKYAEDRKRIADCFIENVEYFRKYHRYDLKIYVDSPDSVRKKYDGYYSQYPGADRDPANFFEPYASRFSLKKDRYVTSPLPTSEQLTVTTDTIVYSKDSLFCVAFLILWLHYDSIEGLEEKRDEGRRYSAKAIIGYRNDIEKPFDIYPLKKHAVIGFESYEAAAIMLKDLYFNRLKGKGSTGSVYEGKQFRHNVGDKDFFEKSPYFQKHKSGLYNFQMYRYSGKDYPYKYLGCEE